MTDREHSEDIADLTAELQRSQMAYRFMAQQLAQKVEVESILGAALNTATILVDQLLTELRLANVNPSQGLLIAKGNFDVAMKRLIAKAHTPPETVSIDRTKDG